MKNKIAIGIAVLFFIWLFLQDNSSNSSKTQNTPTRYSIPAATPKPIILQYSSPPSNTGSLYFNNYPCTEDCSGHEAGYEWAEENGIDDMDDCGGNSNSFIEGCESYVEENYPEEEYNDYDY